MVGLRISIWSLIAKNQMDCTRFLTRLDIWTKIGALNYCPAQQGNWVNQWWRMVQIFGRN